MKDRVCVVTGATSGIGAVTATALARRGATVVIIARNGEKAARLTERLRADTGNPRVEFLLADLARPAETRAAAREFLARYDRLDRLINNAGGTFTTRQTTEDGLEQTFALNHLGYFVLTEALHDALAATPKARVVSTASAGHRGGRLAFDDLQFERRLYAAGWPAYCQSKLANVVWTRALAERLAKVGVVANCVHPGVVATGFLRNNGALAKLAMRAGSPFMRTPAQGADTIIWAATDPAAAELTGCYLSDHKVVRPARQARRAEDAERLWAVSEEIVAGVLG